jgi:tetratricopeptide (TPR) repeat protein
MLGFFNRFSRRSSNIGGLIGFFELADWWLSTFSDAERAHIEKIFQPMGGGQLTTGRILSTTQTAAGLLQALAGWFNNPRDRHIARRILAKTAELAESDPRSSIMDRHFACQTMIEVYYPDRGKVDGALGTAIAACERQINIAPQAAEAFRRAYPTSGLPAHVGFEQLAIIREKQGEYAEAIRLCKMALEQGWRGDWEKRIERCQNRLSRRSPPRNAS